MVHPLLDSFPVYAGAAAADYLTLPVAGYFAGKAAMGRYSYYKAGPSTQYKRDREGRIKSRMDTQMSGRRYGGSSNYNSYRASREHSHFMGRFTGPKRRKAVVTKHTKFGITTHREFSVTAAMDNVLYVGASSYNHTELMGNLGCAFIRRLFMMNTVFRQVFQDYDEPIPASASNRVTIAFQFRHVHDDDQHSYNAGSDFTAPFTSWFTVGTTFRSAGLELAAAIQHEHFLSYYLHRVIVLVNNSSVPGFVPVCTIDCSDWLYHMYSCVSMKVQNVTPADDGIVLQSTDITANPLNGSLFRFSGITPKVSSWNSAGLNWGVNLEDQQGNDNGLIYPSGANPPGDGWNTIPKKQLFKNCTTEMVVRLEPGHIKFTTVKFKFHGTMVKFLNGIFGSSESAIVGTRDPDANEFGTSFLFALEKTMRTGDPDVKCNIQLDVSCGCYCQPKFKLHANTEVVIGEAPPPLPEYPA